MYRVGHSAQARITHNYHRIIIVQCNIPKNTYNMLSIIFSSCSANVQDMYLP